MTFGGYSLGNTIVHRMHPSIKFLMFLVTIAMIFVPNGFAGYIILSVWIGTVYALSGVGWRTFLKTVRSILILAVILFAINWLTMNANVTAMQYNASATETLLSSYIPGPHYGEIIAVPGQGGAVGAKLDELISSGLAASTGNHVAIAGNFEVLYLNHQYGGQVWYAVTDQAIFTTIYVAVKICFMIMIASVLTHTTSSLEMTSAIEDLLRPLKIFRLPVSEAAMMISIALRFVPSLVDESQRILKAQASRGVDATNGTPWDKIKSVISLVVPLFSVSFQKADDLANAMEARSYNPRYARTRYRKFKVKFWDYVLLFFLVAYLVFMICWAAFGFYFAPFGNPEAVLTIYGAG